MKQHKKIKGYVLSDKMKDTAVVLIESHKKDKKYKKSFKYSNKIKFDDKGNKCKTGDFVIIEETKPISRAKSWKLHKIILSSSEVNEEKKA